MSEALNDLLSRLRESYIEVSLHKTNSKAWRVYIENQRAIQRSFSDGPESVNATKKKTQN